MTLEEYVRSIREKSIGIIGIGVSNEPLITMLLSAGCHVTACDKCSREEMGEEAQKLLALGADLRLGEDYLENLDFDVIFRTPGLMPFEEHLERARQRGSIVTSEMEVFFQTCPCRVIAVTGSDGKTTTTTIISELLKPQMKAEDVAVLELSSFQLHSMLCRPSVSVITNISPNHLDKHKDFEDYVDAKKSIYRHQKASDVLVLNADDGRTPEFAAEAHSQIRFFSTGREVTDGVFYRDDLVLRARQGQVTPILKSDEILLPGVHNLMNYMAAFAATEGDVPDEICRRVAMSFRGVEHRLETVRVRRGVTYINDSIGTSPTRTIAGLHALKTKPIVIAGGYDKHIPFDTLGDELCQNAKAVLVTGATADRIAQAVKASPYFASSGLTLKKIDGFDAAVMTASEMAEEGDIVLLSPACAAFDAFKNFAERGRHFKKLIMELEE